jgi:hypothetical protein
MTSPPRREPNVFQCLHLALLLVAIVAAGFWTMDNLTDPYADGPEATLLVESETGTHHPGAARMLILIVDSLRYETATDPEHMPHLVSMVDRSTSAKMQTTRDAITVPALRAAFTGEDRVTIFGFVRNLWHGQDQFSSLFSQLQETDRTIAVFSDGSFEQFARDIDERRPNRLGEGEDVDRQNFAVEAGLETFLNEEFDVVIVHVTYTDHVAHREGIYAPRYRQLHRLMDDYIARIDEAIGPDETFVVMGDHGHDEAGRHQMGLDVPTFCLYRGPGYAAGVDLSTIPITDTRYLVGWGLKLPLPADYRAGRHPEALISAGEVPQDYQRIGQDIQVAPDEGVLPSQRPTFFFAIVSLGLLITLWLRFARDVAGWGWISALGTWAVVLLFAFPSLLPVGALLSLVLAVLLAAAPLARRPGQKEVLWTVLPLPLTLVMTAWGLAFSLNRTLVHYPPWAVMIGAWIVITALGLLITFRYGAKPAVWMLVFICGLVLYPTVYRYGAPSQMAPAWLACFLFVVVDDRLTARRTSHELQGMRRGRTVLLLGATILLLLPFMLVNSNHFSFSAWILPFSRILWGVPGTDDITWIGIAVSLIAKLVIFQRPGSRAIGRIVGVAAAVGLGSLQYGWIDLPPGASTRWFYVTAIVCTGALALACLAFRWRMTDRVAVGRTAALACLWLIGFYTIRVPLPAFFWADSLVAAIVLTGLYFRGPAAAGRWPSAYLLLMLVGALATGWVTLAWTFHWLDWSFLYNWFGADFVERNVAMFLAPLVLRYIAPLIMIRIVLADALGKPWVYPRRSVTLLAGIKTLSVLLVACGIGLHRVSSDVYLEAVQESAIWLILCLALFWPARRNVVQD